MCPQPHGDFPELGSEEGFDQPKPLGVVAIRRSVGEGAVRGMED